MRSSPTRVACILIGLISIAACRDDTATLPPSPALQAMRDVIGDERLDRLRSDCPYFDFLILATAPKEILTEARGCSEDAADTTYYLYVDESGTPLVAGRTFSIHPEQVGHAFIVSRDRLRKLTERERPRLLSRYGPSAPCKMNSPHRPYDGWMERWDGDDFGVLLIGSYDELTGSVLLEAHAGEPSCDRMAGRPANN